MVNCVQLLSPLCVSLFSVCLQKAAGSGVRHCLQGCANNRHDILSFSAVSLNRSGASRGQALKAGHQQGSACVLAGTKRQSPDTKCWCQGNESPPVPMVEEHCLSPEQVSLLMRCSRATVHGDGGTDHFQCTQSRPDAAPCEARISVLPWCSWRPPLSGQLRQL